MPVSVQSLGGRRREITSFLLRLLHNYCFLVLLLKAKESVSAESHLTPWQQLRLSGEEMIGAELSHTSSDVREHRPAKGEGAECATQIRTRWRNRVSATH